MPPGYSIRLFDGFGQIPSQAMLQPEPLSGHYRLVTQPKRQRKDTPTEAIQVEVLVTNAQNIDRMALDIHPGTFVFEILADLCVAHTSSILTVDGRTLALDQRVWYDMTIIVTGTHTHRQWHSE